MSEQLEKFKDVYRKTRNYTILTEDRGLSDEVIFHGLEMGVGLACVHSAWDVFNEVDEIKKVAISIKGDWNDADYVEERHIMELDEVIIQKDQAGGLREVKVLEFFNCLSQSLKYFKGLSSHQYKHNWYSYEGSDELSYQTELVEHFIDSIQHIDDKYQKQQAVEYVIDVIDEFLPRANCVGIHSIVSIQYSPVESITVLF